MNNSIIDLSDFDKLQALVKLSLSNKELSEIKEILSNICNSFDSSTIDLCKYKASAIAPHDNRLKLNNLIFSSNIPFSSKELDGFTFRGDCQNE